MDRIAALTVIRGSGECRAYYNRIVSEEMRRMNARCVARGEELYTVRSSRNRMLAQRMREEKAEKRRPVREFIVMIWCYIFCIGLELGLWEYVGTN